MTRGLFSGLFLFLLMRAFAAPELMIDPLDAPIDQMVHIKVVGLEPDENVKLMAHLIDESNQSWDSYAIFQADENGTIDLSSHAPLSGTYAEVDPMGLFWSMELAKDAKEQTCFLHKSMAPLSLEMIAELKDGNRLVKRVTRQVTIPGIRKIPVLEEGLVGNLFLPEGEGPFPGIIVLGGSDGGFPPDAYVAQFANHGYAALGLAYLKEKGLPQEFVGLPLEYFYQAIKWMKKKNEVQADRLAITGFSMGGTSALLVASYYPEIKAVISVSGRGVLSLEEYSCKKSAFLCSPYSFQGKPLPFIPTEFPPPTEENSKTSYFLRVYLSSLFKLTDQEIEKVSIKVENIKGPILLFAGLDDRRAGAAILSDVAYKRLATHNFSHPYQFIAYGGVGHLFGTYCLPYTPSTNTNFLVPPLKAPYNIGGVPKSFADATVDCWKETFKFLKDSL